jgi:hypothetical protein
MSNRKIKPNKKTYYNQERNDFIKQFNILLELNDDKNFINYDFLINNNNIKLFIEQNENNIKKYYKYGKWGYFRTNSKKDISSLIKQIYKEHNYNIFSKIKNVKHNDTIKRTTFLYFFKDIDVVNFSD